MGSIKKQLMDLLKPEVDSDLLDLLPSRYPMIGGALIIRLKKPLYKYKELIGSKLLEIMKNINGVWLFYGKTEGIMRKPKLVCIAGECNPIVAHRELDTVFYLDISKLTFSPGNAGERKKLLKFVKRDEVVVDLFACCGNLSMPIAVNVKPRKIFAVEVNSYAYGFLLKNILVNKVQDIVEPFLMDNHYWGIFGIADHVLLGFLPEPDRVQLEIGLNTLKREGGWVHYHFIVKQEFIDERIRALTKKILDWGYEIVKAEYEKVKGVAPRTDHIVFRAYIRRPS